MKNIPTRICKICKNTIEYPSIARRNEAEKHNRVCSKCAQTNNRKKPNTKCAICGEPIYRCPSQFIEGRNFCSTSCRNKYYSKENGFCVNSEKLKWFGGRIKTKQRKLNKKIKAIKLAGGKCQKCGYDKCFGALDFHHTDPFSKYKSLKALWGRKWETIEIEVKKCELICANCHREHHWKEYDHESIINTAALGVVNCGRHKGH